MVGLLIFILLLSAFVVWISDIILSIVNSPMMLPSSIIICGVIFILRIKQKKQVKRFRDRLHNDAFKEKTIKFLRVVPKEIFDDSSKVQMLFLYLTQKLRKTEIVSLENLFLNSDRSNIEEVKRTVNEQLVPFVNLLFMKGILNLDDLSLRFFSRDLVHRISEIQSEELFKKFHKNEINFSSCHKPEDLIITYIEKFKFNSLDYENLEGFRLYLKSIGYNFSLNSLSQNVKELVDIKKLEFQINQKCHFLNDEELSHLSGLEFEIYLKDIFMNQGYSVIQTKGSGDQGVDLILKKGGEKIAVQAKRYSGTVGNDAVQQVIAGKSFYQCNKAMVVTNSKFSKAAIELAKSADIVLWDKEKLHDLLLLKNSF